MMIGLIDVCELEQALLSNGAVGLNSISHLCEGHDHWL